MIVEFNIDIYECSVTFAWDTSEHELTSFCDKKGISEEYRKQILENYNKTNVIGFVTLVSEDNPICIFPIEPTPGTVAHEIYHICYKIMTSRNIQDEEAWAYLIGYITKTYYEIREEKAHGEETDL